MLETELCLLEPQDVISDAPIAIRSTPITKVKCGLLKKFYNK